MTCELCGERTEVLDTRPRADGSIKRRRGCSSCSERFTTLEVRAEASTPPITEEDPDGD